MPEQPDKCFEHHMLLKRELEDFKKEFDALTKNCKDMHCFFFGGISQLEGHIYFVDKANTQFGLKNPKISSAGKIDIFYLTPYPDVLRPAIGN